MSAFNFIYTWFPHIHQLIWPKYGTLVHRCLQALVRLVISNIKQQNFCHNRTYFQGTWRG